MSSPIALQSTAKDLIVILTNKLFVSPIILTGWGIDNFIEIDDQEDLDLRIGADGQTSVNLQPILSKGTFYLQPLSLGAAACRTLQEQKQLGLAFPSTMTMKSPSGQWSQTYNNWYTTNSFKGFEATNKYIKDVPISWKSSPPQSIVIGDYTNLAINLASAVAQII